MKYYVIGLSNNPNFVFPEEVKSLLPLHQVFSGGRRHYKLVKKHLPLNHHWIEIKGDMASLFKEYKKFGTVIVFASGDPLFYGFANTIQKFDPSAALKVFPWFNSIQILCHKALMPYSRLINTSVHGRSWEELDHALINQFELIGILTDQQKSPDVVAQRMLEYGFDNYNMIIGENLEAPDERIHSLELLEASNKNFQPLNCIILTRTSTKPKLFGIPEDEFEGLPGRPNMITKTPIRLATLSYLSLALKDAFWDIGFCTGSVAIEAKKHFPQLKVVAFEKRKESASLLHVNSRKHSAPGIMEVIGDFFDQDLTLYPSPDSIFIGGHGNRLEEMIFKIDCFLKVGGRIVINSVTEDSQRVFKEAVHRLNYKLLSAVELKINTHNPITILTAEKSLS